MAVFKKRGCLRSTWNPPRWKPACPAGAAASTGRGLRSGSRVRLGLAISFDRRLSTAARAARGNERTRAANARSLTSNGGRPAHRTRQRSTVTRVTSGKSESRRFTGSPSRVATNGDAAAPHTLGATRTSSKRPS